MKKSNFFNLQILVSKENNFSETFRKNSKIRHFIVKVYHVTKFCETVELWKNLENQLNSKLGGEGGNLTPCLFPLNNSETVKAVTLAFCRIQ